jgi:hypothetical protein
LIRRGPFVVRAPAVAVLAIAVLCAIATSAGAVDDPRQTDLLSIGPSGGNGSVAAIAGGASDNGSHVYFQTAESLTPDDTDGGYQDVYERFNGTTTLVSAGGNGAFDAHYSGCSADGSHVFFETNEQLAPTDTDTTQDVYDRFGGTTTQVSQGAIGGNALQDAFFIFNSADGNKVFFESYEQLTTNDTDAGFRDVYQRTLSSSTTSLISIGPIGGGGAFGAQIDGITPDGSHAYFHTDEALTTNDTDGGAQDIYDRTGSTTTRVSTGTNGGNTAGKDAFFEAASTSGSHVFFTTPEQIEPGDTDSTRDIYDRSGGVTTLRSTGPNGGNGPYSVIFGGATTDGSKIWFDTREALVAGDTDAGCTEQMVTVPCQDVYEQTASGTTWVSTGGNGSNDALYDAGSHDGSRVYFHTTESLDPADTDGGYDDVYQRYNGTTSLVSYGGNGPHQASLGGISSDGARAFFYSYESLVPEDTDGGWLDVYESYGGQSTLLSTGPASPNSQSVALFISSTDDGTKVFFFTDEKIVSGDTDTFDDIYQSASLPTPGFPRPKGATPTRVALVPGYQECPNPGGNRQHGGPLNVNSCNPPAQSSSILTVGTMDANGFTPQSVGSVRYIVKPGDFQITASITDVRCRATNAACPGGFGSAYTGKVLVQTQVQITDKYNGSPTTESATTEGFPIQAPVTCAFVSSTIGGACNLTTTMNSLIPGAVTAGQRANWELGSIEVLDAGANGTGYGAGCPPTCGDGDEGVFMRQGVWVP